MAPKQIEREAMNLLRAELDGFDQLPPSLEVLELAVRRVAEAFSANVTSEYRRNSVTPHLDFKLRRPQRARTSMSVRIEGNQYHCYFSHAADQFDDIHARASTVAWFYVVGSKSPNFSMLVKN